MDLSRRPSLWQMSCGKSVTPGLGRAPCTHSSPSRAPATLSGLSFGALPSSRLRMPWGMCGVSLLYPSSTAAPLPAPQGPPDRPTHWPSWIRVSQVTCSWAGSRSGSQRRWGCAPGRAASERSGRWRPRRHHHCQLLPCAGATNKRGHSASVHKLLGRPVETKVPRVAAPEAAAAQRQPLGARGRTHFCAASPPGSACSAPARPPG